LQSSAAPSQKLKTALVMRSYLDEHDLLAHMQELLLGLATNLPEDPIEYMMKKLERISLTCEQRNACDITSGFN